MMRNGRAPLAAAMLLPLFLPGVLVLAGGAQAEQGGAGRDPAPAEAGAVADEPAPGESGIAGGVCLVCEQPIRRPGVTLRYRGRRLRLHQACVATWQAARDRFFAKLQPRGALFQEVESAGRSLSSLWLLFAAYVVVGLIFGALSAYLAVGRGRAPLPWFLAGLACNVIGLAALLARPAGRATASATRAPVVCPACDAGNHPAAVACSACGVALEPQVESETARV